MFTCSQMAQQKIMFWLDWVLICWHARCNMTVYNTILYTENLEGGVKIHLLVLISLEVIFEICWVEINIDKQDSFLHNFW
jgi:hypothetical protein